MASAAIQTRDHVIDPLARLLAGSGHVIASLPSRPDVLRNATSDAARMARAVKAGDIALPRLLGYDVAVNGPGNLLRVVDALRSLPETVARARHWDDDAEWPAVIFGRSLFETLDMFGLPAWNGLAAAGLSEESARLLADGPPRERSCSVGAFLIGAFEGASGRPYDEAFAMAEREGYLTVGGTYPALLAVRVAVRASECGRGTERLVALSLPGFGRIVI